MPNSNSVIKDSKGVLYSDDILRKKEEEEFKEIIRKIIASSYLFNGMNVELIMNLIIRGLNGRTLKIEKVPTGSTVIKEGDKECDYFFLILTGSFGVYYSGQQVGIINADTTSVVGEIGFLKPSLGRTATIKAETNGSILKMNRCFLEGLAIRDIALFYENISTCISEKLIVTTREYSNLIKTGELISYDDNDCKVIKMDNYTENHGHAVRKFKHGVIHIL